MKKLLIIFVLLIGIIIVVTTFKVPFLECYVCNSTKREDCAINPGEKLPIQNCTNDLCLTAILGEITHRGCLSIVMPGRICSPHGSNLCTQCNTSLCNRDVFPLDRRSCYQCDGTACIDLDKSKIKPKLCRNYVKDDTCYSDFRSIHNTVRGCGSDSKTPCKSSKCLNCNFNNCNNLVGVIEHKCYSCNYRKSIASNNDPSCKRPQAFNEDKCSISNITTCTHKVLLGDKPKCYTFYRSFTDIVDRGCSSYKGIISDVKPNECYGDLCNNECIDIKCISCDSKLNPKCRNATNYMQSETCPIGTNYCLACENREGHIIRGCQVNSTENHHCVKCYGEDGCNKGNIRTCYSCTSTNDSNCIDLRNKTNIKLEICDNPSDVCVTTVLLFSQTIRGCLSKVPECTLNDPNCKKCDGSLCNDSIVPKNRIKCHQCAGSSECNIEQYSSTASPCINYDPNGFCYAFVKGNDTMIRGCSFDINFTECNRLGHEICRQCYEDGCNNWPIYRKPKLSCVQCNKTNETCIWAHRKESVKPCKSLLPYHLDETCYIYQHSELLVSRGCSLDLPFRLKENEMVHLCNSNGCNKENRQFQSCIQCTSSEDVKCNATASKISPTKCSTDIFQYIDNHGCFVMRNPEGEIIRGCAINLHRDELKKCKNKQNHCIYCTPQGCNNQRVHSSGNNFKFYSIITYLKLFLYIFIIHF